MTAPSILNRRAATPEPWAWEEHELSEGLSCVVYDEHGQKLADHLDQGQAALIAAAPSLLEALNEALFYLTEYSRELKLSGSLECANQTMSAFNKACAAISRATPQSPDSGGEG